MQAPKKPNSIGSIVDKRIDKRLIQLQKRIVELYGAEQIGKVLENSENLDETVDYQLLIVENEKKSETISEELDEKIEKALKSVLELDVELDRVWFFIVIFRKS